MNVAVIGTGYVGLTTGVALAHIGHHVTCIDMDKRKIELLYHGKTPFFELFLEETIVLNRSRLCYTTSLLEGLAKAKVVFLAVGTPQNPNGLANLFVLKGRNYLDPHLFAGQMRYIGMGRSSNYQRQATVLTRMAI
ncbi:MAG: NAD-binding protein [Dehalobacterium sp.]